MSNSITVRGESVPAFMYGTAWKEDRTQALVTEALAAGFLAIDTANQRKHYFEAGVGEALKAAFEGGTSRDSVFLQTKFTYRRGQDHRLPYDPDAPVAQQVAQSFASSLEHLHTDRLDSYVLHGPSTPFRLTPDDEAVWRAMEALASKGKTRVLGVSNVSLEQLEQLTAMAEVKPAFVQNRCYARTGWDHAIRRFCSQNDIVYQGFSLLTANQRELRSEPILAIAQRVNATVPQVVFRFALDVGMLPLTGTTDRAHMEEDLGAFDVNLTAEDIAVIERIGIGD